MAEQSLTGKGIYFFYTDCCQSNEICGIISPALSLSEQILEKYKAIDVEDYQRVKAELAEVQVSIGWMFSRFF